MKKKLVDPTSVQIMKNETVGNECDLLKRSRPTAEIFRMCQGTPYQDRNTSVGKTNKKTGSGNESSTPWAPSGLERIGVPAARFRTWPCKKEIFRKKYLAKEIQNKSKQIPVLEILKTELN